MGGCAYAEPRSGTGPGPVVGGCRVMLLGLDAASLKLIMKIGSLPDACRASDRTPGGTWRTPCRTPWRTHWIHNQPAGNPATVSALPVIIRFFRAHGYRFARV